MSSIASHKVRVGEHELHYLEAGSGPPVLLLHGWPTNAQLWRHVLPALAPKRRAIALDLPGFGQSDKPTDVRYNFGFFERTLSGFFDALGIDRVGLAVHDLGGPVGLYWAAKHRERVSDLAILNTLAFPEPSAAVVAFVAATYIPGLRSWLTSPAGIRFSMRFGVERKERIDEETTRLYTDPYPDRSSRQALLKSAQGLSPRGLSTIAESLTDFSMPVRILYGERGCILL